MHAKDEVARFRTLERVLEPPTALPSSPECRRSANDTSGMMCRVCRHYSQQREPIPNRRRRVVKRLHQTTYRDPRSVLKAPETGAMSILMRQVKLEGQEARRSQERRLELPRMNGSVETIESESGWKGNGAGWMVQQAVQAATRNESKRDC